MNTGIKSGWFHLWVVAQIGAAAFLQLVPSTQALGASKPGLGEETIAPDEENQFRKMAQEIQIIQERLAKGSPIQRGFHAKAHGCVKGSFEPLAERPVDSRVGVLAEAAEGSAPSFPVWARLSNASGRPKADSQADLRGLALKLTLPASAQLPTGGEQDFLMTNGAVHFAKDAREMMDFAEASSQGPIQMLGFFFTHPSVGLRLAKDTRHKVTSLLSETYWSRTPFLLGARAIHFSAAPCAALEGANSSQSSAGDDYLTDDLRTRMAKAGACFDFRIQYQLDAQKQPLENASVEWKVSETPLIRVARIVFPPQEFDSTAQQEECERSQFDPWRALPEHRPLGGMNRARRLVYPSSAALRGNS